MPLTRPAGDEEDRHGAVCLIRRGRLDDAGPDGRTLRVGICHPGAGDGIPVTAAGKQEKIDREDPDEKNVPESPHAGDPGTFFT